MIFELFLVSLVSTLGGACGYLLANWQHGRRLYNMECDVAALQDRLLKELKQRASLTARMNKTEDKTLESILHAAKDQPASQPALPWWQNPKLPGLEKNN